MAVLSYALPISSMRNRNRDRNIANISGSGIVSRGYCIVERRLLHTAQKQALIYLYSDATHFKISIENQQ